MHKGRGNRGLLFLPALLAAALWSLKAQEQERPQDDRVRLLSAQSAQLIHIDSVDYRKVIGPARFLHNNTYLLCDTAVWNVNTNIIDATGHVRIIQDQTTLSSSSLQYRSNENLAMFRGKLVQLEDKDGNTLRTRYLDYNTKDSVAVFQSGGAMRDKDGQLIESRYGLYDAKAHLFTFIDQVNMYMDTTFVKTSRLEYRSDLSTAYFGFGTDMWQDDNMLSANDGWYDRSRELFFFRRDVHVLTKNQEAWADSIFYYRALNNVDMMGKVELMDTTRNAYALAGRFEYQDSLGQIRMTRDPAVMSVTQENGQQDTLYLGADVLLMRSYRKCDIPEAWMADADTRLKQISGDPVMEYRRKAAEEARKKAEEAAKNNPNRPPEKPGAKGEPGGKAGVELPPADAPAPPPVPDAGPINLPDSLKTPPDSLKTPPDSLRAPAEGLKALADSLSPALPGPLPAPADSLAALPDSLATPAEPPLDTTKLNFLWGARNVRMFRREMQMSCDSLAYTDVDSLARLYGTPIVYNEGNKQYAADSIYLAIRNQEVEKAHLLDNAFITIKEAPDAYDQIRSVEMVAYFDKDRSLTRFDALGGASSLFYLTEEDALATVNKVESKMIYATFTGGEIDHIYYYDNPKNDGYPTVQLPKEEKTLKGFRWDPDKQPTSPADVTSLKPRKTERLQYIMRPHANFFETEEYFPGYITQLYRDIAVRDSLAAVREQQRRAAADSLERISRETDAILDSLIRMDKPDSLALRDSLGVLPDSLGIHSPADSTATQPLEPKADTLGTPAPAEPLTPEQQKALEKERKAAEKAAREAEKAQRKAERQARLEAKWAEQDRQYEQRQAAKLQKKLERERARKLKALRRLEKKAQKERRLLEKYLEKERRKQLEKLQQQEKVIAE